MQLQHLKHRVRSVGLLAALLLTFAPNAFATFVVDARQVGSDVVFSGAGTLDVGPLVLGGSFTPTAAFNTNALGGGGFSLVLGGGNADFYELLGASLSTSTPTPYPPDLTRTPTSSVGDIVGVGFSISGPLLLVPKDYVSGTVLTASMTFANETLASLGLLPGTYEWSWDLIGAEPIDNLVLNVVAVPAPPGFVLVIGGLAGLWMARTRYKRRYC